MEHLDFPGSQLHEKSNVWFYVKLKRRPETAGVDSTAHQSLLWPEVLGFTVLLLPAGSEDGHKSSAGISQLQGSPGQWSWYHGVLCEKTDPVVPS